MAMTEKPKRFRESFVMRCKWRKSLKYLSDGDYRRMMEAMFDFAESGVKPEFENPMLMAVWAIFEEELSKDYENWLAVCERNAGNGRTGGRPRKKTENPDGFSETQRNPENPDGFSETQRNPENPDGFSETQRNPEKPKKADSDSDYDLKEKKIQKEKTSFSFDACVFENLKDRVNKLFNRRSTTAWSEKEIKQLKAVAKREGVLEELAEIETLYNSGYEYRRKDVITFLNNFSTELDRARNRNQETFQNQGETSSETEPMYKTGVDWAEPAPIAGGGTPIKSSDDMRAINFREGEND